MEDDMLVLSRKRQQSLHIRDDIIVKILSIHGNRVRLGIQAPVETPVHRAELSVVVPVLECSSSSIAALPAI